MRDLFTREQLQSWLDALPQLTIGLVGDLFLDRYLEVDAARREWSIETGLEAYQVTQVRNSPGALGTVINNLAALGVRRLVPVTVVGDDGHGDDLLRALQTLPVDARHILRREDRLTPTYTKPLIADATGLRELNRLDVRSREPLSESAFTELSDHLSAAFAECDGWIVLDQVPEPDCGVVDRRMRVLLGQRLAEHPEKLVLIDSRRQLSEFRWGVIKGNRAELLSALGLAEEASDAQLEAGLNRLSGETGQPVFCTVGERGMVVARAGHSARVIPGVRVAGPVDIVGAGDAATSGLVTAWLAGATPEQAAGVANLVASITVQQLGTTGVARPAQILSRYGELNE
jgi:rfaE bifunctional protein kinase chain/domain